jgi:hypothetical protein
MRGRGQYLNLRQAMQRKGEESYVVQSFVVYSGRQILSELSNQGGLVGCRMVKMRNA